MSQLVLPPDCRGWIALLCAFLVAPGQTALYGRQNAPAATASAPAASLPPEQLDSLVAPIALYPDPLLSQVLVASTYPLEIVQLQQWLQQNPGLKDQALADAVKKQDWDPSIQAMAAMPDVAGRLADNIKWTTDLGNAFLAQQSDVMDAVQRMRKKAQGGGQLKTTEQQKVETQVVEGKSVVVIEQANPQVVYVPSYDPMVVYGPPVYPYPPIAYPPGYAVAGMAISFGAGLIMGAAWGGGWGWGCSWGHNDIDIDINNSFNRNDSFTRNSARGGNNTWQHDSRHRGGAPYPDRTTANRFGGTARGDTLAARQNTARLNQAARPNQPQLGTRQSQLGTRQQAGTLDRGGAGGRAQAGIGSADRADFARGGGDRVGNRQVPSISGSSSRSAFAGVDSGLGGSGARASSFRGGSSMRSMGGGMGRGGGFGGRGGRR